VSLAETTSPDYAELSRLVRAEGLLEPQEGYYALKLLLALGAVAVTVVVALVTTHPAILLADAVLLAIASTQLALLAHDVVHRQAFRARWLNQFLRYAVGNVLLGMSPSWWAEKHTQHHANPNHIELDPDLQIPLLEFSEARIAQRSRWERPLIAIQAPILPLLFPFQAVSLRWMSAGHIATGAAPIRLLQAVLMIGHFVLYAWLLMSLGGLGIAIAFAVVHQATFGLYNSSVFASNHKGMPILEEGKARLSFLEEQVMTARNVDGNRLVDFIYGGLNYQIEHHLFPTMPRNNLAKAKTLVRSFCVERGIAYHSTSLPQAYREGFAHLHRTGAALRRGGGIAA